MNLSQLCPFLRVLRRLLTFLRQSSPPVTTVSLSSCSQEALDLPPPILATCHNCVPFVVFSGGSWPSPANPRHLPQLCPFLRVLRGLLNFPRHLSQMCPFRHVLRRLLTFLRQSSPPVTTVFLSSCSQEALDLPPPILATCHNCVPFFVFSGGCWPSSANPRHLSQLCPFRRFLRRLLTFPRQSSPHATTVSLSSCSILATCHNCVPFFVFSGGSWPSPANPRHLSQLCPFLRVLRRLLTFLRQSSPPVTTVSRSSCSQEALDLPPPILATCHNCVPFFVFSGGSWPSPATPRHLSQLCPFHHVLKRLLTFLRQSSPPVTTVSLSSFSQEALDLPPPILATCHNCVPFVVFSGGSWPSSANPRHLSQLCPFLRVLRRLLTFLRQSSPPVTTVSLSSCSQEALDLPPPILATCHNCVPFVVFSGGSWPSPANPRHLSQLCPFRRFLRRLLTFLRQSSPPVTTVSLSSCSQEALDLPPPILATCHNCVPFVVFSGGSWPSSANPRHLSQLCPFLRVLRRLLTFLRQSSPPATTVSLSSCSQEALDLPPPILATCHNCVPFFVFSGGSWPSSANPRHLSQLCPFLRVLRRLLTFPRQSSPPVTTVSLSSCSQEALDLPPPILATCHNCVPFFVFSGGSWPSPATPRHLSQLCPFHHVLRRLLTFPRHSSAPVTTVSLSSCSQEALDLPPPILATCHNCVPFVVFSGGSWPSPANPRHMPQRCPSLRVLSSPPVTTVSLSSCSQEALDLPPPILATCHNCVPFFVFSGGCWPSSANPRHLSQLCPFRRFLRRLLTFPRQSSPHATTVSLSSCSILATCHNCVPFFVFSGGSWPSPANPRHMPQLCPSLRVLSSPPVTTVSHSSFSQEALDLPPPILATCHNGVPLFVFYPRHLSQLCPVLRVLRRLLTFLHQSSPPATTVSRSSCSQEALDLPPPILATEYYTNQEMEGFKKRTKKTRKIRKKPKILKADDLLPLAGSSTQSSDFRHRGSQEMWV